MHTNNDIIISHVMAKAQSLLVPSQLELMGSHEQNLPAEEQEPRRHWMADRKREKTSNI